ncbi:MAG: Gfo/Idh/MocA family oxidoreductase, partial [Mariniphaga sp.]
MNKSRREFIKKSSVAAAGISIVPASVVSGLGHRAPSDKLNIAGVGIGGKGHPNLVAMNAENIVALCDVDWDYAENTFKRWPKATTYKDYRVMFEQQNDIDAVIIATPDHSHALPAILAMR